ncbi:MAG: class I SAM-dependent methyltransferase [Acidimicrobiia bacterium]
MNVRLPNRRAPEAAGSELAGAQGRHPDPLDPTAAPADRSTWTALRAEAFDSPEMGEFRRALLVPGRPDVRSSVIDDLSTYYGFEPEDCVRRCVEWERWSVEEWKATHREGADDSTEFYRSTRSWSFDLLWYAYLQTEGFAYPESIVTARFLRSRRPGGRHLDFGSGTGVTGLLFDALGYETELADIASSMLEFARYRYDRRGRTARFIDLNEDELESDRYDVITALDVLAHVPDIDQAAQTLHRALRPGGWLVANFDVRARGEDETAWHLYQDDLPLRAAVQRAGFRPRACLDGKFCYERVERSGAAKRLTGATDWLLLESPLRPALRRTKRAARRLLRPSGRS